MSNRNSVGDGSLERGQVGNDRLKGVVTEVSPELKQVRLLVRAAGLEPGHHIPQQLQP